MFYNGRMKDNVLKIAILGLLVLVTGATVYTVMQVISAANSIPDMDAHKKGHAVAKAEHGDAHAPAAHGGEHGEAKKADEHGGGHGEAPKAGGHGETAKAGEHGEAPKGGEHGEAKAEEHGGGEHGGGEHGAPAADGRKPASVGLVSIDEVFVNVGSGERVKSLGLKLEVELFEESSRPMLDQKLSGIKHSIIEVAREQEAVRLSTVGGKLYFKECLVSRLNEFFHEPIVRDVHFSSFYLQ